MTALTMKTVGSVCLVLSAGLMLYSFLTPGTQVFSSLIAGASLVWTVQFFYAAWRDR